MDRKSSRFLKSVVRPLSYFALVGLFWVPAGVAQQTNLDSVTREIHYEKGELWVTDKLEIRAHYAIRNRDLDIIFNKVRGGDSNVLVNVEKLLKGDCVKLVRYDVRMREDRLELTILSKVVFREGVSLATLRWVPFWGGMRVSIASGVIGAGPAGKLDIRVRRSTRRLVLEFPDLGPVKEEWQKDPDSIIELMDFAFEEQTLRLSLQSETRRLNPESVRLGSTRQRSGVACQRSHQRINCRPSHVGERVLHALHLAQDQQARHLRCRSVSKRDSSKRTSRSDEVKVAWASAHGASPGVACVA